MGVFENIGKKVSEGARAAAKKSGEMVETTKLNMHVHTEEEKIQKLYVAIGKKVYTVFSETGKAGETFIEECDSIKEIEAKIVVLKEKLLAVKSVKICTSCKGEIDKGTEFCPMCGTKQEDVKPATAKDISCAACGVSLPADSSFCTKCGAKTK